MHAMDYGTFIMEVGREKQGLRGGNVVKGISGLMMTIAILFPEMETEITEEK